jgi:hypothetical protein
MIPSGRIEPRAASLVGEDIRFGLAADAQYADVPPEGTRHYRASLGKLAEAVAAVDAADCAFALHLGDLIDRDAASFAAPLDVLARARTPWLHLPGNHDYAVSDDLKPGIPARLGLATGHAWFDCGGFRFVLVDTNAQSVYAAGAGSPAHRAAAEALARLEASGAPQAKSWNGGAGEAQRAWLDQVCADAEARGLRLLLFGHHPVLPLDSHAAWDAPELLALLERHPGVLAWINGHDHDGGLVEHRGVFFLTLRGMVETAADNAFALCRLLPDRLLVGGHGREPSRELRFPAARA